MKNGGARPCSQRPKPRRRLRCRPRGRIGSADPSVCVEAFTSCASGRNRGVACDADLVDGSAPPIRPSVLKPLRLAPAAEDQAAEGKAEPERADREAADRERLAPRGKPLPATERLALLRRQRLPTALLSDRAAGAQSEVEIVEDPG